MVERRNATNKNTVAIVFTDGEPESQTAAARVIIEASNKLDRDEQLTFLFVQIGNDPGATRYLQLLDDGLKSDDGKGCKFDIVDTVTGEVADSMEPIDLINKAIAD